MSRLAAAPWLISLVLTAVLLTACGTSGSSTETNLTAPAEPDTPPPTATTPPPTPTVEPQATPQPPALAPGALQTGRVTIDGTDIDYAAIVPADFTLGDTAPVLLAMPPGAQNIELAVGVTWGTFGQQALDRGWVVVSPAAPEGQRYFDGSEALIPGLVDWIATWVDIEGDRPHLAGISNGGISSFRLAANQPDGFASIVAFPGYPRGDGDRAALAELAGMPIHMFVGEADTNWVPPMQEAFDTLNELGGKVTFEIRAGEGHVMRSLSDGVEVFDLLDAARPGG